LAIDKQKAFRPIFFARKVSTTRPPTVVSFLGYTGRHANLVATAARDPKLRDKQSALRRPPSQPAGQATLD
jgi:hypothetical protein